MWRKLCSRMRETVCGTTRVRAQVIVLFALASIPLMGAVGLAIDGGYILAQRRAVQNGADAAALAGARNIARAQTSNMSSDMLTQAQTSAGTTATLSTAYNNNSNSGVSLTNATGVVATVTKSFPTFFISIIGIPTYTVSANATGRVQRLMGFSGGAPFIVCSKGLQKDETWLNGGILDFNSTPPSIRPQAIYANGGPEFFVHGSHIGASDGDCDWENGNNFKGNTPPGNVSGCSTLPCWFPFDTGNTAGPTRVRVAGMDGCNATDQVGLTDGCVAILPISVQKNTAGVTCSGGQVGDTMCIVAWAAFQLREGNQPGDPSGCNGNNCHIGRLLGQVLVTEGIGGEWNAGDQAPLMVRLVQ